MDALDGAEAKRLLGRLLAAHPDLLPECAELADTEFRMATTDDVAKRVASAFGSLTIEAVWNGSGHQPDGSYREPIEAAGLAVEETAVPFLADLVRRVDLGRRMEATELCKGILLGVYQVGEADGDFLDGHAPDALEELALGAVAVWKKGRRGHVGSRASPREVQAMRRFVSAALPAWSGFLNRSLVANRRR